MRTYAPRGEEREAPRRLGNIEPVGSKLREYFSARVQKREHTPNGINDSGSLAVVQTCFCPKMVYMKKSPSIFRMAGRIWIALCLIKIGVTFSS